MEALEGNVDKLDNEMNKIWVHVNDNMLKMGSRVDKVEEQLDSSDFSLGLVNDKMVELEKHNESLKEDIAYLHSQSMRNNLIFGNIPEARTDGQNENTEEILRCFLVDKMKIASDLVNKIQFERVHRIGPLSREGRGRKFTLFKEREYVRKQWKALAGTNFYVSQQFPKSVSDKRRSLLPKLKEAKRQNKRAWLAYDTLYIDGKKISCD